MYLVDQLRLFFTCNPLVNHGLHVLYRCFVDECTISGCLWSSVFFWFTLPWIPEYICVWNGKQHLIFKNKKAFDLSWWCPLGFSCDVYVQKPEAVMVPEQIDLPENMCFCFLLWERPNSFVPPWLISSYFFSSSGFWEHLLDFDRRSVSVEHLLCPSNFPECTNLYMFVQCMCSGRPICKLLKHLLCFRLNILG